MSIDLPNLGGLHFPKAEGIADGQRCEGGVYFERIPGSDPARQSTGLLMRVAQSRSLSLPERPHSHRARHFAHPREALQACGQCEQPFTGIV